jgi:hypothetical protein
MRSTSNRDYRAEAEAYRELDRERVLVLRRRGGRDVPVIEDRLTVVCDALAPAAQRSGNDVPAGPA